MSRPIIIMMAALALLACPLLPTPTLDPQDIYVVPDQTVFEGLWAETHGWDFRVSGHIGVTKESRLYRGFESPAGSGKLFVGVFGIVDGKWALLDVIPMETPTPTPAAAPAATPGAGREARWW